MRMMTDKCASCNKLKPRDELRDGVCKNLEECVANRVVSRVEKVPDCVTCQKCRRLRSQSTLVDGLCYDCQPTIQCGQCTKQVKPMDAHGGLCTGCSYKLTWAQEIPKTDTRCSACHKEVVAGSLMDGMCMGCYHLVSWKSEKVMVTTPQVTEAQYQELMMEIAQLRGKSRRLEDVEVGIDKDRELLGKLLERVENLEEDEVRRSSQGIPEYPRTSHNGWDDIYYLNDRLDHLKKEFDKLWGGINKPSWLEDREEFRELKYSFNRLRMELFDRVALCESFLESRLKKLEGPYVVDVPESNLKELLRKANQPGVIKPSSVKADDPWFDIDETPYDEEDEEADSGSLAKLIWDLEEYGITHNNKKRMGASILSQLQSYQKLKDLLKPLGHFFAWGDLK